MTITEVESRVSSVTVYQGRAMITRKIQIKLKTGNHTLVFPGLPSYLDRNSLQVKGTGEATFAECVFETEYFTADVDEKRRPLLSERQKLSDDLSERNHELALLVGEKSFIERIALLVTTPRIVPGSVQSMQPTGVQDGMDVSQWMKITEFYRAKNIEIDRLELEANKSIRELKRQLENLDAQLDTLGSNPERSRDIVKVGISKKTDGDLTLYLSYAVSGPSWRPVYNLRASCESDKLELEYDAIIKQGTGEDWSGTELKLSTAQVNVSGAIPELFPWRLSFYYPKPMAVRSGLSKEMASLDLADGRLFEAPSASNSSEANGGSGLEREDAAVENLGASVEFVVAGGGSVGGDNKDTRVGLTRKEFPAEYLYSSTPKLSEFAYLTARFKNSSDFPILPGTVNVFFDSAFVASSELNLIMPDQESDVSLGIDEGLKVEYRTLRRFKKSEGLVNKKISEHFEFQIRITNNRSRLAHLKVFDQFPISEEKEIVVKALEPLIRDNPKEISLDDESRITWVFSLQPGEKRELPMAYSIEYPAERRISGI